ncbi:MAG: DMT family transporter [Thalassococcus sp.]|nr:DMT family transporter [Thalassococcus sp.]
MVMTGICFVMVTALVKTLGGSVPAAQSAFLRYVLGLVFLLPIWRELVQTRLTKRQLGLFGIRGAVHAVGVAFWFFAMSRIPIAEVTAMNYLTPVFVTILAAFFLGEKLAIRRILAIVAALAGAALILRPGFRVLDPGHLAMLGTATMFSASYLIAKVVSDELDAKMVVAMLSITVPIGLLPLALMDWITPNFTQVFILFGVALFATVGHYTMTRAFAAAPVSVTQPVTFLQLVWSVIIGALFFAEPPDSFVIAGGAVIMAAVSFITWREARAKKRAVTPLVNATKG